MADARACATKCAGNKGCGSFDISPPDSRDSPVDRKGLVRCHLYAMTKPRPASGVKGECFKVNKDVQETIEEEGEDDGIITDADIDNSILAQIPKKGKEKATHFLSKKASGGVFKVLYWYDETRLDISYSGVKYLKFFDINIISNLWQNIDISYPYRY